MEQFYINIAIVGSVSAGKSTLLNSLFLEQFSDMKIKRTTMVPQVYKESAKGHLKKAKEINEETTKRNKEIIEKTEKGEKLNDIYEMIFYVQEIKNFNISKSIGTKNKIYLSIYDIPGLNDSRTKNIYYKYINENFYKFDIVILVIDIMSGFNTSDEMEILKLIIDNIEKVKKTYNKNIQLIAVANKCDNMEFIENKLQLSEELEEMFDQVKSTVNEKIKNIPIIKLSARDAFLYRMLIEKLDYDFSREQMNEIITNMTGKKELKNYKTDGDKMKFIKENLRKRTEDINDIIKASGFTSLEDELKKILKNSNNFLETNESIKLQKIQQITDNNIYDIIIQYNDIFNALIIIEPSTSLFNSIKSNIIDNLEKYEQTTICKDMTNISIDTFNIVDNIIKRENYLKILPKLSEILQKIVSDFINKKILGLKEMLLNTCCAYEFKDISKFYIFMNYLLGNKVINIHKFIKIFSEKIILNVVSDNNFQHIQSLNIDQDYLITWIQSNESLLTINEILYILEVFMILSVDTSNCFNKICSIIKYLYIYTELDKIYVVYTKCQNNKTFKNTLIDCNKHIFDTESNQTKLEELYINYCKKKYDNNKTNESLI